MVEILAKLEEVIVDHVLWDGGEPEHGNLRVYNCQRLGRQLRSNLTYPSL